MKRYNEAADFLGDSTNRYFSNGYRHFHWAVTAFQLDGKRLSGQLAVSYDGPPRPDGPPHLGSMEYTAIASMLTEYVLVYLLRLDAEQVGQSLLKRISMKLQKSREVGGDTVVPFHCYLGEPQWTFGASNGILSPITVLLGEVEIALVADHPANTRCQLNPATIWPLNRASMYNYGYKLRDNDITQVHCNATDRVCNAHIVRQDRYTEDRQGLFSARATVIPTDVLSITGQLMQVLLYTLEHTTREQCSNIWLRTMDIHYDHPIWATQYEAQVRFLDFRTLRMAGGHWRAVELESTLGTIHSRFSIAHQLKT